MSAAPGRSQASSHRSPQGGGVPDTAAPGRSQASSHRSPQGEGVPDPAAPGRSQASSHRSPQGGGVPARLLVEGLCKAYAAPIFRDVSLAVAPGEFVAIIGESGVGKSTLLNCMAGLDTWDAGSITIDGADIGSMSDERRALLRRQTIGFVFQAFHVLPHLDVAQNVALPLMLLGRGRDAADRQRVQDMLAAVGLEGLGERLPQQLSGGQLQRVAIARALVHRPSLLLADEPTGNLDPKTAMRVLDALVAQSRSQGASMVLVTHSAAAAQRADRVLHLSVDGISG